VDIVEAAPSDEQRDMSSVERATIRRATEADVETLVTIVNEAVAARTAFDQEPQSHADVLRWFHEHDGRYLMLVAVDEEGHVLGCASLNRYHPQYDTGAGVADITLFLALGAQRRGLGTRLLTELERHARHHDFHKIVARTFPANRSSRRLLNKFGYRVVGVHRRDAVIDGDYVDVMLLEKLLSPGRYRVGIPSDAE